MRYAIKHMLLLLLSSLPFLRFSFSEQGLIYSELSQAETCFYWNQNINIDFTLCSFSFPFSPQHPSCLFFQYNTQLGPPYHILVDTNFINFSIKAKLDLVQSMMDCLYAKCEYHTFMFLQHLYRIIIFIQIHEKSEVGLLLNELMAI
jgi:hypothetical protein